MRELEKEFNTISLPNGRWGGGNIHYVMEKDVEQYDEFGIVKVNLNYDDDSDFADEKPPADMSYYRDTNDMRGRNLTRGGPERRLRPAPMQRSRNGGRRARNTQTDCWQQKQS